MMKAEDAILQVRAGPKPPGYCLERFFTASELEAARKATGWLCTTRLHGYLMTKPTWGPASLQRMIAARMRSETPALAARFGVRKKWNSEAAAQRERWANELEAAGNPPKPRKPRNGVTPEQAAANRKRYRREYQRRRYAEDSEFRERRKAHSRKRYRKTRARTGP